MIVAFIHTYTCPCGGTERGVLVANVRINKRSLVSTRGLGFEPPKCRACEREFTADDKPRITIDDDDLTKVNAARAKKSWPPMKFVAP